MLQSKLDDNKNSNPTARTTLSKFNGTLFCNALVREEKKDVRKQAFSALDLQTSTKKPLSIILAPQGKETPATDLQKQLLGLGSYPPLSAKISTHHKNLYKSLTKETQDHIHYLTEIGLGERAKGIKLSCFKEENHVLEAIDLTPFTKRAPIPQEVIDFDPKLKNTIITTDPHSQYNKPDDLKKILDIRLYPALRNLIQNNRLEVFLGSKKEMGVYYKSVGSVLLFQFTIPSSATYYLIETNKGELCVIMAGLVSRENIIAQFLTLKLASIKIENIEIVGEIEHFFVRVKKDFDLLIQALPELTFRNHALIVAGCGLESMVSDIVKKEFNERLSKEKSFEGDIVSLIYTSLANPGTDIHGFISLNLNYGEITEYIIKLLLENCNCKHVFTGGAGGYILSQPDEQKPPIGTRVAITRSMNEHGEIAKLNEINTFLGVNHYLSAMHLQIPSIFLETYEWLDHAKQRGQSVDVETFYIIRAIQNYNKTNPSMAVKGDCGFFVSDYVGEQPLREYSKVYQKYAEVLSRFFHHILPIECNVSLNRIKI